MVARGRLCSLVGACWRVWSLVVASGSKWSLVVASGRKWSKVVVLVVSGRQWSLMVVLNLLGASVSRVCLSERVGKRSGRVFHLCCRRRSAQAGIAHSAFPDCAMGRRIANEISRIERAIVRGYLSAQKGRLKIEQISVR